MVVAYQSGDYTMAEIERYFDLHYMAVSRAERCGWRKGDFDGCIDVGTDPFVSLPYTWVPLFLTLKIKLIFKRQHEIVGFS